MHSTCNEFNSKYFPVFDRVMMVNLLGNSFEFVTVEGVFCIPLFY